LVERQKARTKANKAFDSVLYRVFIDLFVGAGM